MTSLSVKSINYDRLEIVALHKYPELVEQCCELINSEWPRSRVARLRSLECSCDNLPVCLVLIEKTENGTVRVYGHSKVSRIPAIPDAGFLESVVIHRDLRRKGLGHKIMMGTEDYMKSLGLKTAYLSTIDQQEFYKKLGYSFSESVSIYGSAIPTNTQNIKKVNNSSMQATNIFNSSSPKIETTFDNSTAPPPPPPPNAIKEIHSAINELSLRKSYMKKCLGT